MPTRRKSNDVDDSLGVPGWMVTFSDCMTLLLCFFVMLVTFSSFDEDALKRISGVFKNRTYGWIFPIRRMVKDSMVDNVDRPTDWTDEGSEKPTDWKRELTKFPKPPLEIIEADAYRDRKVFDIPSERLFYGRGTALRPAGRAYLRMIGSFMALVPCRVVISEIAAPGEERRAEMSLERAWTIMKRLVDAGGLDSDRFHITCGQDLPAGRFRGKSVVRIAVLARSICE